jgi:hypothetical protein
MDQRSYSLLQVQLYTHTRVLRELNKIIQQTSTGTLSANTQRRRDSASGTTRYGLDLALGSSILRVSNKGKRSVYKECVDNRSRIYTAVLLLYSHFLL